MAIEKKFLDETGTQYLVNTIKEKLAAKQDAGNYATLDENGVIPSSLLPSYVDDVQEFTSIVDNPTLTSVTSNNYLVGVAYDKTRKQFLGIFKKDSTATIQVYYSQTLDAVVDHDATTDNNMPSTSTPEAGKIYICLDTNVQYRWSGSDLVEISKSLALGETSESAYAGDKGAQNAKNIAAIMNGDLPLVELSVGKYNSSGTASTPWSVSTADGTSTISVTEISNLTTIYGYNVSFTGNYMWKATTGYKNPTAVNSGDWAAKALPATGVPSDNITITNIIEDRTITASVKAPKQGLVFVNGIIRAANDTDFDIKSASIKVHFQYKVISYGFSRALTSDLLAEYLAEDKKGEYWLAQDGRSIVLNDVSTSENEYFVYAYPSALGELSKITMNDATPLLADGFTLSKITVTDPQTKKNLEYNVYTSVQKGAFTKAKLDIA